MKTLDRSSELNKLLFNKRVLIVGCSPYLEGKGLGEYIDSFDVVVRMNRSVPVIKSNAKDLGTKIDALYGHYSICRTEGLITNEVPWVITTNPTEGGTWPSATRKITQISEKHGCNVHHVNQKFLNLLKNKIGSHPTTGMIALHHLLCFPLRSLDVIGMTFYFPVEENNLLHFSGYMKGFQRDLTYEKYLKQEKKPSLNHSHVRELRYFPELLSDKRVNIDYVLENLLRSKGLICQTK